MRFADLGEFIIDVFFKGRGTRVACVEFATPSLMWGFIRFLGKRKLQDAAGLDLWSAVDKPLEERIRNKATNLILQGARDQFAQRLGGGATTDSEEVKKAIQANWEKGYVYYHPAGTFVFRRIASRDAHGNWHIEQGGIDTHSLQYLDLPSLVLSANEVA